MTEKIRVLHVVGSMNRGGVETWLMHVLRNIDRERFQFDFLVHTSQPAAYDDEIRSLGGRIISCARPKIGKQYPQEFRRAVRTNGPFDVLHSHVHHFSGVTLSLGAALGIPVRIAHSHSDLSVADRAGSHRRKTYLRATEVAIARSATLKLAASEQAAAALYGPNWRLDARCSFSTVGRSAAFEGDGGDATRMVLGLPEDAWVIGHWDVLIYQRTTRLSWISPGGGEERRLCRFLLVGDGPLRPHIQHLAKTNGLDEQILFAGVRSDVPGIMQAMDVFLFPSLWEGLGIVLIEAQAAGTPCVISDVIPPEATVIPELVDRLPLEASAEAWAEHLLSKRNQTVPVAPRAALERIRESPFDIQRSVRQLGDHYECEVVRIAKSGMTS